MALWFAALMGLIQGLTEFLPVSSTAHLRIVPALLGLPDAGAAFTAVIQLGTLAAVIVFFLRELWVMVRALVKSPRSPDGRMAIYLVIGTIPIAVLGVLLKKHIEGEFRSLWVVAVSLIAVGVVMYVVDRRAAQTRGMADLRLSDAIWVGIGQAFALVPGVSRSGATLTAALLVGMKRDDAARFSFLLSVPAVAGAGVFELRKAAHELSGTSGTLAPLLLATAVAFVVGWLAIAWFLRYLRSRSLAPFSIYRVLLGGALIVLLALHKIG